MRDTFADDCEAVGEVNCFDVFHTFPIGVLPGPMNSDTLISIMKEKPIIWTKMESCPLCETKFETENVWTNRVRFSDTYTDMGKKYIDINPLFYEIWVCPGCLYAAYRKEGFLNIQGIIKSNFKKGLDMRKKISRTIDWNASRSFEMGVLSFKLAILCLQERSGVSAARYGSYFLKLAWLFRFKDMKDEEQTYLKLAMARFMEAYSKETAPEVGSMGETGLVYTIGELARRTGDTKTACEYYMKVITNKEMQGDPQYIRLSRDMLSFAKEGSPVEFIK